MTDIPISPDDGPLTDDSPMPFGKFVDQKMKDVPAGYLIWLAEQPWFAKKYPTVSEYVERMREYLEDEVEEASEDYPLNYESEADARDR